MSSLYFNIISMNSVCLVVVPSAQAGEGCDPAHSVAAVPLLEQFKRELSSYGLQESRDYLTTDLCGEQKNCVVVMGRAQVIRALLRVPRQYIVLPKNPETLTIEGILLACSLQLKRQEVLIDIDGAVRSWQHYGFDVLKNKIMMVYESVRTVPEDTPRLAQEMSVIAARADSGYERSNFILLLSALYYAAVRENKQAVRSSGIQDGRYERSIFQRQMTPLLSDYCNLLRQWAGMAPVLFREEPGRLFCVNGLSLAGFEPTAEVKTCYRMVEALVSNHKLVARTSPERTDDERVAAIAP